MAVQSGAPSVQLDALEHFRPELTGYCYRMLGSVFDADDAVQDTMVRAWRGGESFEGRSALRSWVYRIATNVCLDMLRSRRRRARPMELGPPSPADASSLKNVLPESVWIEPIPDSRVFAGSDPADVVESKETVRLAFVTALQHLPARQRAVLILREVLQWQASEVAELLDTSVASVNSALQRARATLSAQSIDADSSQVQALDSDKQHLLARYVAAFEGFDLDGLVTLLREDVVQTMPPYAMWLQGPDAVIAWLLGPGNACKGSRLVPIAANGGPAFAQYRVDPEGGFKPWAIQIIDIEGARITGLHNFLDTRLFDVFGLPKHLDG